MSDGMGREFTYLSSHATNRYFIPNWGRVRMPENGTYFTKTLFLTEKHLAVKPLFDLSYSKSLFG